MRSAWLWQPRRNLMNKNQDELEKFRERWRRWLGNKTRIDKPYWVTLLDSNFVGWVDRVFTDCGLEYHGLSWTSNREQVKEQYLRAINLATMRHLQRLDELYVVAKYHL